MLPGEVEGEVRIVLSPLDDLRVVGKILTTVRTDPAGVRCSPV